MENVDIYNAAQSIKNFSTGIFPSHWLEMAKTRLYSDDLNASWTLHRIVKDIITVFTPICPFFCHHISLTIYDKSSVMADKYPKLNLKIPSYFSNLDNFSQLIIDFNSFVWKKKKDNGFSLKSEISDVEIPKELEILSAALVRMHNLK